MADARHTTLDDTTRAQLAELLAAMHNSSAMLFAAVVDSLSNDTAGATANLQDFMTKSAEINDQLQAFMQGD